MKVIGPDGRKLPDSAEAAIEEHLAAARRVRRPKPRRSRSRRPPGARRGPDPRAPWRGGRGTRRPRSGRHRPGPRRSAPVPRAGHRRRRSARRAPRPGAPRSRPRPGRGACGRRDR
ncbi:MAG: hypothetical protein ACKOOG_08795 [Actinomycetota bacterium]